MPTIPGSLIVSLRAGWTDGNGDPCAGFLLYFYEAGTTIPKDTFSDPNLEDETVNMNPVVLDSNGRATVYLAPGGYTVHLHDADDALVWTALLVEDIGQTFLASFGVNFSGGGRDVTSGYTVLDTDSLVTVESTGGEDPCIVNLPPVVDRGTDIIIKNLGDIELEIRPNGSDTIDGQATYTLAVAASPVFPTLILRPDGVSEWFVISKFEA